MSICDLKPGEKGLVSGVFGDDKLMRRLLALGCTEGTEVLVKTTAPLGDPIILKVRGSDLAIRKKDAKNIYINELEEATA